MCKVQSELNHQPHKQRIRAESYINCDWLLYNEHSVKTSCWHEPVEASNIFAQSSSFLFSCLRSAAWLEISHPLADRVLRGRTTMAPGSCTQHHRSCKFPTFSSLLRKQIPFNPNGKSILNFTTFFHFSAGSERCSFRWGSRTHRMANWKAFARTYDSVGEEEVRRTSKRKKGKSGWCVYRFSFFLFFSSADVKAALSGAGGAWEFSSSADDETILAHARKSKLIDGINWRGISRPTNFFYRRSFHRIKLFFYFSER